MSNALHQMTMSYSAEQDRLLFRISTTGGMEAQLWLTRRFVKVLWPALIQSSDGAPAQQVQAPTGRAKEVVRAVAHQEALQKVKLDKPHDQEKRNTPLTEVPLLVVGGNCRMGENGITHLTLRTDDGRDISLGLNAELLHGLLHQISTLASKAGWDLDLMVSEAAVSVAVPPEGKRHLH
ncbi:MAG: hypothetical protein AB7G39_02010 [Alphaproteobacteria bacterium]